MKNIVLILLFATPLYAQTPPDSTVIQLEKNIPILMQRDLIPGLTAAYIHAGAPVWSGQFGVSNAKTGTPVTDSTLFEAASLTKVVTAYAALKLVDAGRLALDTPLNIYLGNNYDLGNDPRASFITARRVLTHSAGFPNWRNEGDSLLPINFVPGSRFGYSGEGFVFLARVMEKITGMPFEELIDGSVFSPLKMRHSSLMYLPAFRERYAYRHNWLGEVAQLADYRNVNAAASLRTTAVDFALFLAAVLNGEGLSEVSHREMLTSQIMVDTAKMPQLAWGVGIGLEVTSGARYCWHWGDQGNSKAFFVANTGTRDAVVYFTNSANGLSVAGDMAALALGNRPHDMLAWVAYGKFDPAAVEFANAVKEDGAAAALQIYQRGRKHVIGESALNDIGYELLRGKDIRGAIAVFTQNTIDYPSSYNVWDSLAEAYMNEGNKPLAIRYYEKSLVLNPANHNAVDQLKKLRQP